VHPPPEEECDACEPLPEPLDSPPRLAGELFVGVDGALLVGAEAALAVLEVGRLAELARAGDLSAPAASSRSPGVTRAALACECV